MARSKISKELIQELYKLHSKGMPIKYCCDTVGIAKQTYYNWYNRGKAGDNGAQGLYIELYDKMRHARACCIQHLVNKLWNNNSTQAIIYMLRLYDPETFNIPYRSEKTQKSYVRLEKLFDKQRIEQISKDKEE